MAFLSDQLAALATSYPWAPAVLLLAYVAYSYLFNPLAHIPGPAITRLSNIRKLAAAYEADFPKRNIALHEQYGPLVRLGPNFVSVNDPAAHSTIYGFRKVFDKNPFYAVAEGWHKGQPLSTPITTRDEKYHTHLIKGSKSGYQALADAGMEERLQGVIELLLSKIDARGNKGRTPVDAASMLAHFAFDAIGVANISETFGFLETGADVQDAIAAINMANGYFSVIAQAPWMHTFLLGNRFAGKAMEGGNPILNIAIATVQKRMRGPDPKAGKDLLSYLLDKSSKDSNGLTEDQIVSVVVANLMAGYATVALTLRAITYFLCKNPRTYQRLQREIDDGYASGGLSEPVKFAEAAKLPYLDAVIAESLRVHPSLGLPLGRVVPDGGVVIADKHIPAGTVVGINPWVMHSNKEVYGADADVFRPERWMESGEKKLAEMKRLSMSFGGGPRTCQGRDMAMVEMKKLIPQLMRRFDFSLANPDKEWDVTGHWFTFQANMDMNFVPRKL